MFMASAIGVLSVVLASSSVDIQANVVQTLTGQDVTAMDSQRSLAELMGWRADSLSGLIASGEGVAVEDYDPTRVQAEVQSSAPVQHYFGLQSTGAGPIRIYIPADQGADIEVYRRVTAGLYVQVTTSIEQVPGYVTFEVESPGKYVTRIADEYSYPQPDLATQLDWGVRKPPSSAPEAKAAWALTPIEPERLAGPTPLVLIHGMRTDNWASFIHWAVCSAEAEAFRAQFQVWDFVHPTDGVNAAIGFSPEYPAFRESMAAYLNRFIIQAAQEGVPMTDDTASGGEQADKRCFFPPQPYCILAYCQGGLVARAFMKNFPMQAERILGVVTLGSPHMGTPFATPEWVRHTLSRLGFSKPSQLEHLLQGSGAELFLTSYFSDAAQSDLDMGWANSDAFGRFGIPSARFATWRPEDGFVSLTLSPRDANRTGARLLSGFDDVTFEPGGVLPTYCGGLDEITPDSRGEFGLDRFFLYGGYIDTVEDWRRLLLDAKRLLMQPVFDLYDNVVLRVTQALMGVVAARGAEDASIGLYAVGDGLVPLQSQLILDGKETDRIYVTTEVGGIPTRAAPTELRKDVIVAHTLADPDRIRILRGWSHTDLANGRYDLDTYHSDLFCMIAQDLLSVLP